jgi:phage regulator Rha-like protein
MMMNNNIITDMCEVAEAARTLAKNLRNDITNASTRWEHIRLTQLALEAERLAIAATEVYAELNKKQAQPNTY